MRSRGTTSAVTGIAALLLVGWLAIDYVNGDRAEDRTSATTPVVDRTSGMSIRVPRSWHGRVIRSGGVPGQEPESSLEAWAGSEHVFDPDCKGVDESARVRVFERRYDHLPVVVRPARIDEDDGETDTWETLAELECDEVLQTIQFTDRGRTFVATVTSGRHGPTALRHEAYEILDSFSVSAPNK